MSIITPSFKASQNPDTKRFRKRKFISTKTFMEIIFVQVWREAQSSMLKLRLTEVNIAKVTEVTGSKLGTGN